MRSATIALLLAMIAGPALAQIGLPPVGQTVGGIAGAAGRTLGDTVDGTLDRVADLDLKDRVRSAQALVRDRLSRIDSFVRANRATIERDETGAPARRGIVLLLDPDPAALETARNLGFAARPVAGLETLGLAPAELEAPRGVALADALKRLRVALPGKTLSSDPIHFPSGAKARAKGAAAPAAMAPVQTAVGLIDGGVAGPIALAGQRGFAQGAPAPADHATAIAALLRRAGVTRIYAADVYGRDPAGGSALAIARALDWLAGQGVPIVSISLVGPRNPLLERAVAAAGGRGLTIFAAVGNDGPAAPPAFPASYAPVIAVTAVDGHERALIEAGRALHLDYAAPGADLRAPDARGRERAVRGTSFAVPFVAARAAAALDGGHGGNGLRPALDAEARDLGAKGPDPLYGRGLLCGECAAR